ncbi:MAG TPA: PEGA domain-containing protein [Bryobacteraceae bacterium]|nr:PEGA domain-containing protein [Bryobacteraceae bacterium]
MPIVNQERSSTFSTLSRLLRYSLVLAVPLVCSIPSASAQGTGYIKAHGKPGDAGVFINGQYVGPAVRFTVAEKYPAPAGEVEVTFRDPRYEDYTTKVTVTPKKTTKIKYSLKPVEPAKPPFGRLRLGGGEAESFMSIASGDTGAVYINDKFFGYVDELNNPGGGLLLNPGTYDLHVVSPIFGDIRQKVTIEANKVTVIPLKKEK